MAEGWNYRFNCRYSARSLCPDHNNSIPRSSVERSHRFSRGDRSYSGDRMALNPSRTPCKYFQRGNCVYGENCRFLHNGTSDSLRGTNKDNNIGGTSNLVFHNLDRPTTSTALSGTLIDTTRRSQDGSRKAPSLRKQGTSADSGIGDEASESWVNAPEFIPSSGGVVSTQSKQPKSYAEAVNTNTHNFGTNSLNEVEEGSENKFCPYMEMSGRCEYEAECPYLHGDICEFCGKACLHPTDREQRKQHHNECIKQHEIDMELSFAVQRSKDKVCGVCMEVIMEKSPGEQRFGILPNCNHCFCLTCIRKWRQAKQFENKIIRACPECRVTSDFVCPSVFWVDTKEEKEKLIQEYKGAMSVKNCKYFKSGSGKCPFGNKCFYLHAYPDGTKADVGPPPRQRRQNADGDIEVLQQIILWDFLEERDNRLMMIDDLEDFVAFFSDSEESDWSEYDLFYD